MSAAKCMYDCSFVLATFQHQKSLQAELQRTQHRLATEIAQHSTLSKYVFFLLAPGRFPWRGNLPAGRALHRKRVPWLTGQQLLALE